MLFTCTKSPCNAAHSSRTVRRVVRACRNYVWIRCDGHCLHIPFQNIGRYGDQLLCRPVTCSAGVPNPKSAEELCRYVRRGQRVSGWAAGGSGWAADGSPKLILSTFWVLRTIPITVLQSLPALASQTAEVLPVWRVAAGTMWVILYETDYGSSSVAGNGLIIESAWPARHACS